MLPKNKLGRQQLRKLKVYAGGEHPHQAQQPHALDLAAASEPARRDDEEIAVERGPATTAPGAARRRAARVYLRPGAGEVEGQRPQPRRATSPTKC